MKVSAFSLIELMVVIAIVAIIAAVAIPAYSNYMITSRFATIVPVVNSLIQQSIQYSSEHGVFANAYDLGLSATPGSTTVDTPSNLSPYFVASPPFTIIDPSGCGSNGYINGYLNPSLLGFSSSVVDSAANLGFECDFWNYQGIINSVCEYFYGTNTVSQTSSLLPVWINENTNSGWNYSNWGPYETNLTSWQNQTCQ